MAEAERALVEVLERSRDLGFLGPGPVGPHIEHARRFAAALIGPPPGHALDLGSGGGLPGLVLVAAWPTTSWCLLDASQRRTDFLTEAIESMGVADRVRVLRGRAEELAHQPDLRGRFDLVTARSFGKPAVTAECAAGFLAIGATLVVSEPPADRPEDRWDVDGLRLLGLRPVDRRAGCQVLTAEDRCPDQYPRRVGIPAKRPLFG